MSDIKNINIKEVYREEYNKIKEIIYAWQRNEPMATDLVSPSAVLTVASDIFSLMYMEDHDLRCSETNLKSDYGKIAAFLSMLKRDYANEDALGSSIEELENCLGKIILMTQTQKVIHGEGEEPINYGLITADLSFRMLYDIFDTEVLGAPVEENNTQS